MHTKSNRVGGLKTPESGCGYFRTGEVRNSRRKRTNVEMRERERIMTKKEEEV